VLVGINLLREGLDIPECSCVAILDADKEGFLRSQTSLIQTIGRAARNLNGVAILYADVMTDSLRYAIDETNRRRAVQQKYNEEHGIEPASIIKSVDSDLVRMSNLDYFDIPLPGKKSRLDIAGDEDIDKAISRLTKEMKDAAKNLDFERAAEIRDKLRELKEARIFV
jgi:excinuclease ABC subunit B